jgi:HK97 family phage major capsid protein
MSEVKEETKEEVTEVGQDVVDAVAEKVTASMKETMVMPTASDIAKEMAELNDKVLIKNIKENDASADAEDEAEDTSKEMNFARGLFDFKSKNFAGIQAHNAYTAKKWKKLLTKSDFQNVTTAADGGSLVPDPEFIAEVERLTDEYGVAARLCNVRMTNRDSVTLLSGTNEVSFTKVGEHTASNAQKLTYAAATQALDKYILTIVVTSELLEDAAINIWQDVTNQVAQARAKLFDELVFTDATYGLLSAETGDAYKTQAVGSAITDLTPDDLMDARYKVVGTARKNGRYFMHPTIWNYLRQQKESTAGGYLFGGVGQSVNPTIDGVPVELVDILPEYSEVPTNTAFAVYGDLGRVMIHVKRLLETKIFDAGTVADAGGTDTNLITQDSYALRATLRAVPQTRFPGAFVVIGTGTVS